MYKHQNLSSNVPNVGPNLHLHLIKGQLILAARLLGKNIVI